MLPRKLKLEEVTELGSKEKGFIPFVYISILIIKLD